MKKIFVFIITIGCTYSVFAQKKIKDQAIIYQEERMVYKQWDKKKFTPEFKWYNPGSYAAYAATWLLHLGYKNGPDLRPLRPGGEQTQRLALAAAMQVTSNYYKKESDTLRNTAITKLANYSGTVSFSDPLYFLFYRKELQPLDNIVGNAFVNTPSNVILYMANSGAYEWYLTEMNSLRERFEMAKSVDIDRGQRILMYHRILLQYRQLVDNWKGQLANTEMMLTYQDKMKDRFQNAGNYFPASGKSEDDVMNSIINNRQTLKP